MTRTERTYYLVFTLYSLAGWFIAPIYALFLLSRGLDLFQINAVLATYFIAACVLEVPTGAVADLFGRKLSFVLACGVRTVAFTLYFFATTFTDCLVAEFVDAIGSTFANGALDAWAIDGRQAEGARHSIDRFFARAQMLMRIAMIVGGVASGYLAQRSMELPWMVAAIGFALTGIVGAVVMREPRAASTRSVSIHRSVARTVNEGLRTVRTTPVLLLLCGLTLVTAFGLMPTRMFWQPRLQALTGEGVWLMGWIWALLNLAGMAGSALLPRVLGHFGREYVLSAAALWRGTMFAVIGVATGFFPALSALLCEEIGFGVTQPLLDAWTNEHTTPERRATVLSVRAMCFMLGGGAGLVCIGLLARGFGMPVAWIASATILALSAPGYLILGRAARRERAQDQALVRPLVRPEVSPSL